MQQARGLERLLELRQAVDADTLSARVIGADATPWFRTLTIDRGSLDQVHENLAVIAPAGIVGRIVGQPGLRAARVHLLIDRNAAAGALIERTRAAGIIVGQDDPAAFSMEYVSNQEDVAVGDRVIASGLMASSRTVSPSERSPRSSAARISTRQSGSQRLSISPEWSRY